MTSNKNNCTLRKIICSGLVRFGLLLLLIVLNYYSVCELAHDPTVNSCQVFDSMMRHPIHQMDFQALLRASCFPNRWPLQDSSTLLPAKHIEKEDTRRKTKIFDKRQQNEWKIKVKSKSFFCPVTKCSTVRTIFFILFLPFLRFWNKALHRQFLRLLVALLKHRVPLLHQSQKACTARSQYLHFNFRFSSWSIKTNPNYALRTTI